MPGPGPGIVNTEMTKTWSLTPEVQSHEEAMQTVTCETEGGMCWRQQQEEVALKWRKIEARPRQVGQRGKGVCWSMRSVWGSFVVGGGTGQ